MNRHLWEIDHPYYCAEEGYYYNMNNISGWGAPSEFRTFDEFLAGFGDADFDMNLVFRWDWTRETAEEFRAGPPREGNRSAENGAGVFANCQLLAQQQYHSRDA